MGFSMAEAKVVPTQNNHPPFTWRSVFPRLDDALIVLDSCAGLGAIGENWRVFNKF